MRQEVTTLPETSVAGSSTMDERYMARALELAARGRGRTHPDPLSGCVLVQSGAIVGEGYHPGAGRPHAEVYALRAASGSARGATAYVTMEPCTACISALIAAGVSRVVVAGLDPDPRVTGRGCNLLRQVGVRVEVGLLGAGARQLNRAYLVHRLTGRPLVTLVVAMTLDGHTASAVGETRGVIGETASRQAHALRDEVDAVCIGVGTIHSHDPDLTYHPAVPPERGIRDPLRVIVDSLARTSPESRVLSPDVRLRRDAPGAVPAPTLIVSTDLAPRAKLIALERAGAEVLALPAAEGLVPLPTLLDALGRRGVCHLLIEGGAQVNWSFLSQRLVDTVHVYLSNRLIGGAQAPGPVGGPGVSLAQAFTVADLQVYRVGTDLRLSGDLKPPPWTTDTI